MPQTTIFRSDAWEQSLPADVIGDNGYLNPQKLFYAATGVLPDGKKLTGIQHERAAAWLHSAYDGRILRIHKRDAFSKSGREAALDNHLFWLEEGLLVEVDNSNTVRIFHTPSAQAEAEKLCNHLMHFGKRVQSSRSYYMVVQGIRGLALTSLKFSNRKVDLAAGYNDDLLPVHNDAMRSLRRKGQSGLYLFYGAPGTGKTTYLRHLISSCRREVIFLSPSMAGQVSSPHFLELLVESPGALLVVEDAEELLASREGGRNSAISTLLNLTDGLLGDSLGIQVVCTFNTALVNIDSALLRQGRLLGLYEFKPLEQRKAQALLQSIGSTANAAGAMTLADVYHVASRRYDGVGTRAGVGFRREAVLESIRS